MAKRSKPEDPPLAVKPKGKPKKKGGRPPLITAETVHAVGQRFSRGLTLDQACRVAGIKLATWEKALQRKPDLDDLMETYRARFIADAVDRIYLGDVGWQGAAWLLERRHPGQFGRGQIQINQTNNTQQNNFALPEQVIDELGLYAKEFNVIEQVQLPERSGK